MNLLIYSKDSGLKNCIREKLLLSIFPINLFADLSTIDELESFPNKQAVDILLVEDEVVLPDNGGIFQSIQELFAGKPVVALIKKEELAAFIQCANKYAHGFLIKPGINERLLDAVILQAVDRVKTRTQLVNNSRQMKNLMDNLPGVAYRCVNDKNWTMEFISAGCFELTGYDVDALQNNKIISFNDLIHPDDRQLVYDAVQKALDEDRQYRIEYRIITASGQEKWVWEQGSILDWKDDSQKLEGFIIDITNRRLREINMTSLVEVGNVIRDYLPQPDFGERLIEKISGIYDLGAAAIGLFPDQSNTLFVQFAYGKWKRIKNKEVSTDKKNFLRIFQNNEPIIVDSGITPVLFGNFSEADNFQYQAYIPLKSKENSSGLLILGRDKKFSDQCREAFIALGYMVASALEKQDMVQRLEKQLENVSSLHKIDQAITGIFDVKVINQIILDELRKSLQVDAANILHLNSLTHTLDMQGNVGFRNSSITQIKVPVTTSIAGKVLMERSMFQVPDLSTQPIGLIDKKWLEEGFKTYIAHPLIVKGKPVGVVEVFFKKIFHPDRYWNEFFGSLATQAAMAYNTCHTFSDLQNVKQNLANTYNAALETWSKSLELNNIESQGHIQRVTSQTLKLAKELGVAESDIPNIERGALLHDIGKLGILDEILLKKEKLTESEWHEIEKHPVIAKDLLSGVDLLKDAIDIPYSHHENWDGSGYPLGLKGNSIPLAARIFSIIETYDALLTDKPFRKAWAQEKSIEYMKEEKGKKFDPEILEVFFANLPSNNEYKH